MKRAFILFLILLIVCSDEIYPQDKQTPAPIPYSFVEGKPVFGGGDDVKIRQWVHKQIIYPQDAIVNNIEVIKKVHPLLDNEAARVVYLPRIYNR
ncbi:MAG: hypothetical protein E7122_06970 [Bacteroidales bacterium]|nr:hypothetical protein [Bacteroidales bacterium]